MSVHWMSKIWKSDKPWSGSKLLIMLALADFANDDGYAWPSIATIASKCRLSARQAQRIIHELIDEGALEIAKQGDGRGNSTFYRIKDVADDTVPPVKGDTDDTVSAASPIKGDICDTVAKLKRVTSRARKSDTQRERVTPSARKGDIAMSPDPLVDPPIDPSSGSVSGPAAHAAPPTSDTGWPEFVGAFCKACHQHDRLADLTEVQRGQVLAEAKRVRANGYTVEDLRLWWQKCWAVDSNFKWRKHNERPTPVDIRTGIAALDAIKAEMTMLREAMDIPRPVIERGLPLTPERALWQQITTDYAQLHDATLSVEGDRWVITTIMADWCRVQLTRRIERDLKRAGVVATVEFAMKEKEQVTP